MKLTPFGDAMAGALGAVLANTAIYPMDVVKTRLQVQTPSPSPSGVSRYRSLSDGLMQIYCEEGAAGLYSGLAAGTLGTIASSFSYFYCYSWVHTVYRRLRHSGKPPGTVLELVLGALAGAMSQLVSLPVAVATTRQQTAPVKDRRSLLGTLVRIVQHEGVGALWCGLRAALVLTVNPAITYGLFERLKRLALSRAGGAPVSPLARLTPWQTLLIGAASKTLATVVTYPYIMAKVRLQWRPTDHVLASLSPREREAMTSRTAFDVLAKSYRDGGLRAWYSGMSVQIYKAVLCQAILFVLRDELSRVTWRAAPSLRRVPRSLPVGKSF
ncbi:hypothetical protein CXG81DRAFT_9275 [Caulochytrium protostelioides]|uniref:Mitochondrial carrier n=1 Tax=Caulochytrium protostelioides TaxID=1555241 RepID=A0A4P9XDV2_9FUNG|nr:hypothetical protein CXG81DRAFT_9275 [Caulochytrium protostelioides]|eukprot:RKP03652.1 hypothetical protein CXG81DRAFT_9275 [Caulochytrium protostelioides]